MENVQLNPDARRLIAIQQEARTNRVEQCIRLLQAVAVHWDLVVTEGLAAYKISTN